MNKEPTPEQIREFWEGYEVKPQLIKATNVNTVTVMGKKFHPAPISGESYPPIDLNNLFLYAVSKVDYCNISKATNGLFVVSTKDNIIRDKDPALALFWALWAVMKEAK